MSRQSTVSRPHVDAQPSTAAGNGRRSRPALAYHRILVHVATSAVSERAVVIAAQLASEHRAEVTLLNVIEVPKDLPLDALFPDEEHEGREALRRATAILDRYGVDSKTRLTRSFSIAKAILEAAAEANPELIVMGAERHMRRQPSVFGHAESIQEVLKAAPCRVMLVTPPAANGATKALSR